MTSRMTTLQRVLCAALLTALVALIGGAALPAFATPEGDITYTVRQVPAAGAQVKVGDRVTFEVDITATSVALNDPKYFDLKLPANMRFDTWGSRTGSIVQSCERDVPNPGYVRCTTKANSIISDGADKPELELRLQVQTGAAGQVYSADTIRGLFADEGTGFRSDDNDAVDNIRAAEDEVDVLDDSVGAVTVEFPAPTIAALSPNSKVAGSEAFTLTVTGTGFVSQTKVLFAGTPLFTEFVSTTEVRATVPASMVAEPGTPAVTVQNPAPGGGTSPAKTFTVSQPPPPGPALTLTGMTPTTAIAGATNTTVTVTGTGFVNGAKVRWDGADLATTFTSSTQLKATIPAALLAEAGEHQVTVVKPDSTETTPLTFTVNWPAPKITAIKPDKAEAGSGGLDLDVTGTGFVATSEVHWGEKPLEIVSQTSTKIVAKVTADDLKDEGTVDVTVVTPGPFGSASAAKTFTVTAPALTTTDKLAHVPVTGFVPRSRLAFTATSGDLAPDAVSFTVKRVSDGKFWNGKTSAWQADAYENNATKDAESALWSYAVTGAARRQFVNTQVEVTVNATKGDRDYVGAEKTAIAIR